MKLKLFAVEISDNIAMLVPAELTAPKAEAAKAEARVTLGTNVLADTAAHFSSSAGDSSRCDAHHT
jgi:hypothetical protein